MRPDPSVLRPKDEPEFGCQASTMIPETILVGMIEEWAARQVPGDADVAEKAAALALQRYADGASVSEACEEAQRFVRCWMRHPSRTTVRETDLLIAS